MNALQIMVSYWKEVKQVSTYKNDLKVQYYYNSNSTSVRLRAAPESWSKYTTYQVSVER